jgi:hypothetical protein
MTAGSSHAATLSKAFAAPQGSGQFIPMRVTAFNAINKCIFLPDLYFSPMGSAMTLTIAPTLDRRRFLTGGTALGFAAGLSTSLRPDRADAMGWLWSKPAPDWDALALALEGPLLRPKDSPFEKFSDSYNLAYEKNLRPMAIAMCASTADVRAALLWANNNKKVGLVARAGGHSYAGYSTTDGLMINVSTVRGFNWNSAGDEITFGAGARNADLYKILRAANRTVTHGRCPTVGAAGFLLGGGIGFNMRLHGVASDLLVASKIVTADGDVKQLSATQNEDLFWACRGGGGGNFGINTSFTLKTVVPKKVTFFKASWSGERKVMANVAFQLMKSLTGAENEFGSRFALTAPNPIGQNKEFGVNIIGQFQSDDDRTKRVEELLGPALTVTACKKVDTWPEKPGACQYQIAFVDYWTAQTEGRYLLDTDKPFAFHERSAFLSQQLTADDFDKASQKMMEWQGTDDRNGTAQNADLRFFQTGGVMNTAMKSSETAFVHRDSIWLMDIGLPFTAADGQKLIEKNIVWQNEFFDQMWPYSNKHAYQNFIDPMLTNYANAYYGDNLKRLRDIKAKYDPEKRFDFPQAIQPS